MKHEFSMLLRTYDYLVSTLTGLGTAMLVSWLVSPTWSMATAMLVGVLAGLAALALAIFSLGWIAGAFEILMPGKFIVMIVGMGGGMWVVMDSPTRARMAALGIMAGIVMQGVFHLYDNFLHGEKIE